MQSVYYYVNKFIKMHLQELEFIFGYNKKILFYRKTSTINETSLC